jgi:hypothetical protein
MSDGIVDLAFHLLLGRERYLRRGVIKVSKTFAFINCSAFFYVRNRKKGKIVGFSPVP